MEGIVLPLMDIIMTDQLSCVFEFPYCDSDFTVTALTLRSNSFWMVKKLLWMVFLHCLMALRRCR